MKPCIESVAQLNQEHDMITKSKLNTKESGTLVWTRRLGSVIDQNTLVLRSRSYML